jgi:hypothetical protein
MRLIVFCCLQDGCKAYNENDPPKSTLFFKRLAELIKEKEIKVKIAVEANIQFGSKNGTSIKINRIFF